MFILTHPVNFPVGGNRSARRKPTTFGRVLTDSFHMKRALYSSNIETVLTENRTASALTTAQVFMITERCSLLKCRRPPALLIKHDHFFSSTIQNNVNQVVMRATTLCMNIPVIQCTQITTSFHNAVSMI